MTGSQPKKVIIRGLGPSLTGNVSGALADPVLELHNASGALLTTNDNWKDTQQVEIEATMVAPANGAEAAIVQTLPPGNYTAILRGKNNTAGIGSIEVYDLDSPGAAANLANVSTRGQVGLNDNVMIGGFIVGSGGDATVVIRAIGPSLTNAGIAVPLLDPTLEFHDRNGALIDFNDNWKDTQPAAIKAAQLAPPDNRESVIVASVPPGNYTAIVRGKNSTTGVALVEIYRIQ